MRTFNQSIEYYFQPSIGGISGAARAASRRDAARSYQYQQTQSQQQSLEQQRLELEKQKLELERQKLELERQRGA